MKTLVILIGSLIVTSYRSVPAQTDDSPYYTSIGERCNAHGIAVSQDLLKKNGGPLNYGDLVYVEGVGFKFVNDCMNARHKQRADVWVANYTDEKVFEKRHKHRKLKIWKVEAVPSEQQGIAVLGVGRKTRGG